MRNGSLWSDVVFEKEAIFHEFDFETSNSELQVPKSSIWKHTTSCDYAFFSFHYYLALLTTDWAQLLTGLLCWDTQREKTGLWQLPIVYTVFNLKQGTSSLQSAFVMCVQCLNQTGKSPMTYDHKLDKAALCRGIVKQHGIV